MAHKSIYKKGALFESNAEVTAKIVQLKKTEDQTTHYRLQMTSGLNIGSKVWFTEEQLLSGTPFKECKEEGTK